MPGQKLLPNTAALRSQEEKRNEEGFPNQCGNALTMEPTDASKWQENSSNMMDLRYKSTRLTATRTECAQALRHTQVLVPAPKRKPHNRLSTRNKEHLLW